MSIEPYDQSYLAPSSEATLTPTTERIIKECPRARILVIGRSGVGKSSLVNAIFKTSFALVEGHKAGEADINKEYTSEHNERFVLHDSQGYEPGNEKKFKVLENFIKARTRPEIPISKQLHAIWLCISVPHAGGRIFERGEDNVFKFERAKVPIIVVFTKFDRLAASARLRESGSFSGDDGIKRLVGKTFEEKCAAPFKLLTRDIQAEIPFLPVSIRQLDTLQNLVKVTVQNIQTEAPIGLQGSSRVEAKDKSLLSPIKRFSFRKNIKHAKPVENQATSTVDNSRRAGHTEDLSDSAQVALAMAQRISEPEKIEASITVGKKKYWREIASGIHFIGFSVSSCSDVIHRDIINIWNIRGMDEYFLADAFRGRMTRIVEDLSDRKGQKSRSTQAALGAAAAAAGIAAAVAPPAAVIAAPVAAVAFLAAWAYDIYKKTPDIIRCLMGYVVDLTVIMQAVFRASRENEDGIIQRDRVEEIIEKYDKSPTKERIHDSIRGFVQDQFPFHKSTAVEKIELLVNQDITFT